MAHTEDKSLLGKGWSLPLTLDTGAEIMLVPDEEDVRQAIMIILGTSPGERVMRPEFGAGLRELVFEPMNTSTMALVKYQVEQALINWEPRIDSISVEVTTDQPHGRLLIAIDYRIRATNTFYNLVYPFYLQESARP